jgi:hypothetical protein
MKNFGAIQHRKLAQTFCQISRKGGRAARIMDGLHSFTPPHACNDAA